MQQKVDDNVTTSNNKKKTKKSQKLLYTYTLWSVSITVVEELQQKQDDQHTIHFSVAKERG